MKLDRELMRFEENSIIGLDHLRPCCERRKALARAFDTAIQSFQTGQLYRENVSNFTLLNVATHNYVSYLAEIDEVDLAFQKLFEAKVLLNHLRAAVLSPEIQAEVDDELELLGF